MAAVVATKQRKRNFTRRTSQREGRNGVKEYQIAEADVEKGVVKAHAHRNGENDGGEQSSNREYETEYNVEDGDKQKPDVEEGDVLGIITMEDVMEELLQVPFTSTFPREVSIYQQCLCDHAIVKILLSVIEYSMQPGRQL